MPCQRQGPRIESSRPPAGQPCSTQQKESQFMSKVRNPGRHAARSGRCTVNARISITGNSWVDDNEHPFVGLVVFYDAGGAFLQRCSGSLISPTKVLTAGHCIQGAVTARIYLQQNAGGNYDPVTQLDRFPATPRPAPGTRWAACVRHRAGSSTTASTTSPASRTRASRPGDPRPSHLAARVRQLPSAGTLGQPQHGRAARKTRCSQSAATA